MTIQCCRCKKVRQENEWSASGAEPLTGIVSHTYCPECLTVARAEIKDGLKLVGLRPSPVATL